MEKIDWQKFSIEALVIVVSILLAFSIEAWWGERQDRQVKERLLSSALAEINTNIRRVEISNSHRTDVEEAVMSLLAQADSPNTNGESICRG